MYSHPTMTMEFHRHKWFPWANIYGKSAKIMKAQTVLMCSVCGKRKFIKEFIEAPIDYNVVMDFCALALSKGVHEAFEFTKDKIIKNQSQYIEYRKVKNSED